MDADSVRLVSFNVRRDRATDGEFDWAGRREAVVSTLDFHRPDVVGLQEPLAHQYADVREGLSGYEWVGRSRKAGESDGEYCPVGYRADRFDRLDDGTLWLSETPAEPGSVGWDAARPRILTWVRLRDREADATFVVLNTHLDHEGERARREGARLIRERVGGIRAGAPAVLSGDFNCTPGERPHAILAGADSPLADAREVTDRPWHGPDTTRTTFEDLNPDRAIDHAFVAGVGVGVSRLGVATDQFGDGWFPSDHLPLVVDLDPRW